LYRTIGIEQATEQPTIKVRRSLLHVRRDRFVVAHTQFICQLTQGNERQAVLVAIGDGTPPHEIGAMRHFLGVVIYHLAHRLRTAAFAPRREDDFPIVYCAIAEEKSYQVPFCFSVRTVPPQKVAVIMDDHLVTRLQILYLGPFRFKPITRERSDFQEGMFRC